MAHSERHIDATPDEVFDVLVDAERYPRWLVGAQRVDVDDGRWPQPGSSFHHTVGAGPITVDDSTTVSGAASGRRLDLVVRARPFLEADVCFMVRPDGAGTLLTMDETPRGPFRLLTPVIAPLVKLRNDRSLQRLAAMVRDRP